MSSPVRDSRSDSVSGSEISVSASSSLVGLKVWLAGFQCWFLLRFCEDGGKNGGTVASEVDSGWFASRVGIDLDVSPVLAKLLSWGVRVLSDRTAIWALVDM